MRQIWSDNNQRIKGVFRQAVLNIPDKDERKKDNGSLLFPFHEEELEKNLFPSIQEDEHYLLPLPVDD